MNKKLIDSKLRKCVGWRLSKDGTSIWIRLAMKNFISAIDLIKRIARLAEKADHHPDLHLTNYRQLRIVLSTHSIGGLSQKDFDLAQKINHTPKKLKIL